MIDRADIPEIAICHKCGEPMQVVDLAIMAERLGYQVPEGSFVLECCGYEQTIDDPLAAQSLLDQLIAYHEQKRNAEKKAS